MFQRGQHRPASPASDFYWKNKTKQKTRKVAESGFLIVDARRSSLLVSAVAADSWAPATLKIRGPDNLSTDLWRTRAASANQLMRRRAKLFTR